MIPGACNAVDDLLRSVAGTGELVTVVYNGGSHPGQPRQVVPVSINADELVVAEAGSNFHKHYKLDKISSVELSSGRRASNPDAIHMPELPELSTPALETLAQYAQHFRPELEGAGWNVILTDTEFAVGGFLKNGKPRRTPRVSVRYFEPNEDPSDTSRERAVSLSFSVDTDGSIMTRLAEDPAPAHSRPKRPWRVDSSRYAQGKTFREIRVAVSNFIDEVRACTTSDQ
jgi:hypothetical protein